MRSTLQGSRMKSSEGCLARAKDKHRIDSRIYSRAGEAQVVQVTVQEIKLKSLSHGKQCISTKEVKGRHKASHR